MVDQGGSGGTYESGGFNPDMVYNNDAANAAVESLGKVIGAGLSSRTAGDQNEEDIAKVKRLQNKGARIYEESKSADPKKRAKMESKANRIVLRIENTNKDISKYNEGIKPSLKSTLATNLNKDNAKEKSNNSDYRSAFEIKNKLNKQ